VAARHSRKYGADLPTISRSTVNGANDGFLLFFNDNSNPQVTNNTDIQNMGGTGIAVYDMDKAMPNRSTVSGNSLILKSGFGTPAAGTGSERGILILGPCTNTDIATQHFVGPHAVGLFYQNASTKQQIHAGNAWTGWPPSKH